MFRKFIIVIIFITFIITNILSSCVYNNVNTINDNETNQSENTTTKSRKEDKFFDIKYEQVYDNNISYYDNLLTISTIINGADVENAYYMNYNGTFKQTQQYTGTISINIGGNTLKDKYQYFIGPNGKKYTPRESYATSIQWFNSINFDSSINIICIIDNTAYIQIYQKYIFDTIVYDLNTDNWHYLFDEVGRDKLYSNIRSQYDELPQEKLSAPYEVCYSPCLSPDGTKIGYIASDGVNTNQGSYYIYDLISEMSTKLYDGSFATDSGFWSPSMEAMEWVDNDTLRISPVKRSLNIAFDYGSYKIDFYWNGTVWNEKDYGLDSFNVSGKYYYRTSADSTLEFEDLFTAEKYLFNNVTINETNRYISNYYSDFSFTTNIGTNVDHSKDIIFNPSYTKAVFRYNNSIYLINFDNCLSIKIDPADYIMKYNENSYCKFYFINNDILILNVNQQATLIKYAN